MPDTTEQLALPAFPPSTALPPTTLVGLLAKDGAGSLARLAIRGRRDGGRVKDEYDEGTWRRKLESEDWRRATDLESYLTSSAPSTMTAKLDGKVRRVEGEAYYRWRIRALQAIVSQSAGAEPIVELGCGFGGNLFSLALQPDHPELVGLDISANAVLAARRIAERFAVDRVTFGEIDLTQPTHPGFAAIDGRCVLTYLCLEQLPVAVGTAIDGMLAGRPKRVVHVESAAELVGRSPLDLLNRLYVRSMDYQRSLVAELRAREAAGSLRVLRCERLPFAPTMHNDTALIVWEPVP